MCVHGGWKRRKGRRLRQNERTALIACSGRLCDRATTVTIAIKVDRKGRERRKKDRVQDNDHRVDGRKSFD